MRAVVVAGADSAGGLDGELLESADLVVAADRGAEALARLGRIPDVLVGDMDSITPQTRRHIEAKGVEVILLPPAKDETDTEAAVRLAIERGAEEIIIYGALGGPRLDHLIANLLLLLAPWLEPARVRMVDDLHEVFLVKGEADVRGKPGDVVSLLPLDKEVKDVRTDGLLYPLAGEALHRSPTRGVSNVMIGDRARVTHGPGELLLIHYRGR
jgi:thiamine pyrophosphokinase